MPNQSTKHCLSHSEIDSLLARRLKPEILEAVKRFCAHKLQESEYDILVKHPDIVNDECVSALCQVAIRANSRMDTMTAYRYHRKSEILKCCLEKGSVNGFFRLLDDIKECQAFFDRIGPPPGYYEDFFENMTSLYFSGDNLRTNTRKQIQYLMEIEEETDREEDVTNTNIDKEQKWIINKYIAGFVNLDADNASASLGVDAFNDKVQRALHHQHQQRRQLIYEFVHRHSGMKKFFNWFLTMLPANQIELLTVTSREFLHQESVFKEVLSPRQIELICPELFDVHLLVKDDAQLLFELFIQIALGKENTFHLPIQEVPATTCDSPVPASNTTERVATISPLQTSSPSLYSSPSTIIQQTQPNTLYTQPQLETLSPTTATKSDPPTSSETKQDTFTTHSGQIVEDLANSFNMLIKSESSPDDILNWIMAQQKENCMYPPDRKSVV